MTTPVSPVRGDDLTHCITCSDALEFARLDAVSADASIGTCVDAQGHRSEVLLGLVPAATVGSWLLVHAGVALLPSSPPDTGQESHG